MLNQKDRKGHTLLQNLFLFWPLESLKTVGKTVWSQILRIPQSPMTSYDLKITFQWKQTSAARTTEIRRHQHQLLATRPGWRQFVNDGVPNVGSVGGCQVQPESAAAGGRVFDSRSAEARGPRQAWKPAAERWTSWSSFSAPFWQK